MSIGERIAELRKAVDLSQGQVASLLNVSRQAVSKWENDTSSPDTVRLIQLADVLNTDVEYLATGKAANARVEKVYISVPEIREKIVEKPVEKPVIRYVEKPIIKTYERTVEKPVIKRIVRVSYVRNPIEFLIIGIVCFAIGMLLGHILL